MAYKPRVFVWRHGPFKGHLSEMCVAAFMEAPAKWGDTIMGSMTMKQADRKGLQPCDECLEGYALARYEGRRAAERRRIMLFQRRMPGFRLPSMVA